MSIPSQLIAAGLNFADLEAAAAVATVAGIWLTTRRRLLCWPVTLLADLLYLAVFARARLFSDALLQLFFVGFTFYGWWNWSRGLRQEGEVRVERLGARAAVVGLAVTLVGAFVLGLVAERLGAALPWLDAALAAFSLLASWWQARRYLANWGLWIAVDLAYIGEYLWKGLRPTAVLYAGLVLLAAIGLRDWRRALAGETQTAVEEL